MVVAAPAAASIPSSASSVTKNPSSTSRSGDPQPNTSRRPLTPSERDNAASSRRPRSKEITSRHMPYYSSSSNSTSYASNASTSSSLSSSSSRRFPSPLPNQRPSTPSKFSPAVATKRSQSVDRTRPSTPRADLLSGVGGTIADRSNATRALCTTTRSLSVSFQGESFFYQTSKAKTTPPVPARKPTPERRRSSTPAKNSSSVLPGQVENSKPIEHHHRWPAASTRKSNLLSKSLDCSAEKQELFSAVKLLRQTMLFDNGTGRASFDGLELSASSDTDSVSSGSNSGTPVLNLPRQARVSSQGISVPARFWQETNSRLRNLPEPGTPLASAGPRNSAAPKLVSVRRSLIDRPLQSPRTTSSPLRGLPRPSSPSKLENSPARGISSPSRARGCSTLANSSPAGLPANAPSIISFAAEVRRNKKGEIRIEEAHMLRLLHNRHLQWRCVNARTSASLMIQRVAAEKNLCDSCITTTDIRDSITVKKIKLHLLAQNLKLMAILKGQMIYLEEWSLLDREHSSSLLGSTEALKASILRLPIVGGARADMQEVKDAVGSAVDVMQAMGASIYSLLSKVESARSLVSELAKDAELELALLEQSRELLSAVAALHVKLCSLQGQLLQVGRMGVPNRS